MQDAEEAELSPPSDAGGSIFSYLVEHAVFSLSRVNDKFGDLKASAVRAQ